MARAWEITAYDGVDGLQLVDCAIEQPGPTEVRLRIEAFALNWGDADLMNNLYSFSFSQFPARIGMEAAGIVEAVGEQVTGIETGDRYCTLPHFYDYKGAGADTLVVDQKYLTKAPDGLSAVESASIWMQFMTAYFPIVELSNAAPGRNILVPAGTSTAGCAALQIGRMYGATMISTTRSEANRQLLMDSGADHVFVDDGADIEAFLRDVTGNAGVHAAFDPVGGEFMDRYVGAMAKGGLLFLYGGLSGSFSTPPLTAMFQGNLWFHAYSLFNYVDDSESNERGKAFVYKALADGTLAPNVDRVFPMEGYVDAWRYMKSDRPRYGKVVIETGA